MPYYPKHGIQSNCTKALSYPADSDNTIVTFHGSSQRHTASSNMLTDRMNTNQEQVRHLPYLGSPFIFSFRAETLFVGLQVVILLTVTNGKQGAIWRKSTIRTKRSDKVY